MEKLVHINDYKLGDHLWEKQINYIIKNSILNLVKYKIFNIYYNIKYLFKMNYYSFFNLFLYLVKFNPVLFSNKFIFSNVILLKQKKISIAYISILLSLPKKQSPLFFFSIYSYADFV